MWNCEIVIIILKTETTETPRKQESPKILTKESQGKPRRNPSLTLLSPPSQQEEEGETKTTPQTTKQKRWPSEMVSHAMCKPRAPTRIWHPTSPSPSLILPTKTLVSKKSWLQWCFNTKSKSPLQWTSYIWFNFYVYLYYLFCIWEYY